MSLVAELEKLEQLHRQGALTDAEYAQAKAKLLDESPPEEAGAVGEHLKAQLAEVRQQNDVTQLDREWEMERQSYLVSNRYGRQMVPTTAMGFGTAVVGGGIGLLWLVMATTMMSDMPSDGAFGTMQYIFPIFGLFFIAVAVAWGVNCYNKAQRYEQASQRYQQRRAELARKGRK